MKPATIRLPFLAVLFMLPLLSLSGCGGWRDPIDMLRPHQIDIQQGNVVTQEMLDRLRPGMTPAQVRFILGTPLIRDPFNPQRWDYVYHHRQQGQPVAQRRITVVFENQQFKGVEGDVQAAGAPRPAAPETAPGGAGR